MEKKFMDRAIELARSGMEMNHGGPFGCVIVKNGAVIGEGYNRVITDHDPTAHAEVVAIREACKTLNDFQLAGCEIYTSCEPCPMCLGAIYWARPERIYYASTRKDAAEAGFDDEFIYKELDRPLTARSLPMIYAENNLTLRLFEIWKQKEDKVGY